MAVKDKNKTDWAKKEVLAELYKGKSKEDFVKDYPHLDKAEVEAKYDELGLVEKKK